MREMDADGTMKDVVIRTSEAIASRIGRRRRKKDSARAMTRSDRPGTGIVRGATDTVPRMTDRNVLTIGPTRRMISPGRHLTQAMRRVTGAVRTMIAASRSVMRAARPVMDIVHHRMVPNGGMIGGIGAVTTPP